MPDVLDVIATLVRLVHLGAACLLTGIFAFLVLAGRPAFHALEPGVRDRFDRLDSRLLAIASATLGTAVAAGLLDLARQAFVATRGSASSLTPHTLATLLTETRFGDVWLLRHALWLLLGALLILREPERDRTDWLALRLAGLVLAATALMAGAASGHAASAPQRPELAVVADALHLLATGVWAGGLVPLALFLRWCRPDGENALPATAAVVAVRRFSAVGATGVAVIVVTGGYALLQQIGDIPALLGTAYGRWLCVKLLMLVPLLGVALLNRASLRPQVERAACLRMASATASEPIARLSRFVLLEAILLVAILTVVAILGLTTPARHDPVTWPLSFRFSWDTIDDLPGARTRVALGGPLVLVGLVAALLAIALRRRWWQSALAAGAVSVGFGLVVALPPLAVDAYPTTYVRPTVPYSAASIARGQTLYRAHCASCHARRITELTDRRMASHTAGDLFWWLTSGIPRSVMPAFGDRLTPEQRWDLVNFLRTLGAAEQARTLAPLAASPATLVAPDVSYTTGVGAERSLREYRGQTIVVLVLFRLPESLERLSSLGRRHFDFRVSGAEIVAVPLREVDGVYRALAHRPVLFPVVIDGAEQAASAYTLFAQDLSARGRRLDPAPDHMELLIDRQGYLRARWLPPGSPDAAGGWSDVDALLREVQRLAAEPSSAPTPSEHVH